MNKDLFQRCGYAVFGILSFLVCFSASAETSKQKVMDIQHWKTKGGANVYFVRIPNLPMLDVRVVFAAGSVYDGKSYGLASLTNSLIGEGTKTKNADQIAATFDRVGAQFSAAVDRDMAVVSLRSLTDKKYLKPALSEFSNVLTKVSFPPKAVQRMKNHAVAAIKVSQQEPQNLANNAFYAAAYGKQDYAHQPLGTIATVKQLTKEKLQKFYSRYYVARNANIIMVGNLTLPKAKNIAVGISQHLASGRPAKRLKLAVLLTKPSSYHINFPAKQTSIVIGQVGITRKNPDYFPLVVGNYVFGGLPQESILFQQMRDKRGLTYHAASAFQPLRYRGPFMIAFQTRANKSQEAKQVAQKALQDYLLKGPTKKQLEGAKQNMIEQFPLALATNSSIIGVITRIAFYHLPLNYLDTYRSKLRAVTVEQVKEAFKKTIHPNKMIVVSVGPKPK